MEAIIVLVVIAVVVIAVVQVLTRRRRAAERDARSARIAAADAPGSALRALRVGDIVGLDGLMWTVAGALRFDEDGFTWAEFLLTEGDRREWLSVEDDEGVLSAWRWTRADRVGLEPTEDEITVDGVAYAFSERGSARFTSEGTTGAPAEGTAEYADYEAGAARLGFERYTSSGSWEVSVGRRVADHEIDVFPGSDPAS